jgi:hypothetical protein
MKKIILLLLAVVNYQLLMINSLQAQDGSRLQISLLTCTPGEELYSSFGHSAFRVIDSNSVTDLVYNYGTFNFDDDGFYLKFIRGKLLYYVSLEDFNSFQNFYRSENRGITEQVLELSPGEKNSIRHFLNENLREENKYYKYDFFFDNCTTRLRDIIKKQHDSAFCGIGVMPTGSRFRQAIHEYLEKNGKYWSELGIDILLGLPCDAVMTPEQMQFLPDNLMKSLDTGNTLHPMVQSKKNLYAIKEEVDKKPFFTPLVCLFLLLLLVAGADLFRNRTAQILLQGFDGMLFFLTGLLGIVIIGMWTGTDHLMCRNNFNLLWAWPTHLVMAFFVNSRKAWVKRYFGFTGLVLTLLLIAWGFLPQRLNVALVPVVLLMAYRSARRFLAPVNEI